MRNKAGPVALVVAVVAVVGYLWYLYQSTWVRHVPPNYVPAQARAQQPEVRSRIRDIVQQRWGGTAVPTPIPGQPVVPKTHRVHGD